MCPPKVRLVMVSLTASIMRSSCVCSWTMAWSPLITPHQNVPSVLSQLAVRTGSLLIRSTEQKPAQLSTASLRPPRRTIWSRMNTWSTCSLRFLSVWIRKPPSVPLTIFFLGQTPFQIAAGWKPNKNTGSVTLMTGSFLQYLWFTAYLLSAPIKK